jgi:hypothetical protein
MWLSWHLQKLLEGTANRPENGIYFQGQPEGKLLSWPYVNKNTMYYDSSEQALVPLTDGERAQQVQVRARAAAFCSCESGACMLFMPACEENAQSSGLSCATCAA